MFQLNARGIDPIHFSLYYDEAPQTCKAFLALLPLSLTFLHARVSGQEIWTDGPPSIDIPQENSSVFTNPGEVVFGPRFPARNKTANCMGIYYGEGKGLDSCNIFACVVDEHRARLQSLGDAIWRSGAQTVTLERIN